MLLLLSFVVLCYGHKVQQKQVPHDDSTSFPLLLCPLWLLLALLCCCSATALLLFMLLLLLAFNASQAFCFVVALWLLLIWFLFTGIQFGIEIPFTAYKTYNLSSLLLLLPSLLAAAWVATAAAAASTFDFRFEFSSSFLQLLHTTLISTQRCTNTQHKHTYRGTHSTRTHTLALIHTSATRITMHTYRYVGGDIRPLALCLKLCVPLTIARLLFNLLRRYTRLLHAKTQSVLTALGLCLCTAAALVHRYNNIYYR